MLRPALRRPEAEGEARTAGGAGSRGGLRRLATAVAVLAAFADAAFADALDPRTYASPSGEYALSVDPEAPDGSGPACYRMTRGGDEVWGGHHPFSLWDAEVTDRGSVVGYAYEGGVWSGGLHGPSYRGLVSLVLGEDGRVLRRDPASSHDDDVKIGRYSGSDSPAVNGLFVDPDADRFVVRVPLAHDAEVWWTYRISTGEWLGRVVPDHAGVERGFAKHLFAEVVPGTPLTFVHTYRVHYDDDRRSQSAVLGLLARDGSEVWRYELPGEYDRLGDDWHGYWDLAGVPIAQAEVGARRFAFRSYSFSARLPFTLERDPDSESGWRVRAAAPEPDELPVGAEEVVTPEPAPIELGSAGVIELHAGEAHPVGGISAFAIDRLGNLGFVRWGERRRSVRFVLVDPVGSVLTDAALALPHEDDAPLPRVAPLAHGPWVLLRSSHAGGVGTRAWWLDPRTGELELVEGFEAGGSVDALVPTGDGGFVALVTHYTEYTIEDELVRFDRDAARVWSHREPGYGHGLSYEDATWIDGVGVAASTSGTIERFDTAGRHLGSTSIADALGRVPTRVSGLAADAGGGLVLFESLGASTVFRVDASGSPAGRFRPRFPDATAFRIHGGVQAAPDGALWTSDRDRLLRLDDGGTVDRILGPRPGEDGRIRIRALALDAAGRLLALDGATAAVHAFDRDGTPVQVYAPRPGDAGARGFGTDLAVDGSGNVFVERPVDPGAVGPARRSRIGFAPGGTPLDASRVPVDPEGVGGGRWLFQPGRSTRWVIGDGVRLADAAGRVLRTITRRPNGDWLQHLGSAAVAADGSLAVIASPGSFRGPAVLCLYDADGEPLRQEELGASTRAGLAIVGSTVITVDDGVVELRDVAGGSVRRFVPPEVEEGFDGRTALVPPGGGELWLYDAAGPRLLRYELP